LCVARMSYLLLLLLHPLLVLGGGEGAQGELGIHGHTAEQEIMRGVAQKQMDKQLMLTDPSNSTNGSSPIFFSFTDSTTGELLASMGLELPVNVDLASTKCQGVVKNGNCCDGKGKDPQKCDEPGMVVADMTSVINFALDGMAIPSVSQGENGTLLTLTIKYTDLNLNVTGDLKLTEAKLVMMVTTEGITRPDYWNMTSASLSLTGSFNGTALPVSSDITPKSGYSWAEPACTAPYGICAPIGLSWTCTDQVLAPMATVLNNITLGAKTVRVHLPGLILQLGNSTEEAFPWDCEPLIPLSVWVSVLISLFLASLLMWSLYMLASLQTPSKFDDPKGPSIHVPTSE